MMKTALPITLLATLLVSPLAAGRADAQAARTFVAAHGADTNQCSFGAPCRTLQHAHDITAAGGEIDVLDPAGYGAVTIAKAISIQGHGYAGVSATGGANGITISAGPTDKINLRGLILEGSASGAIGILFNAGGTLNIQDSVIRNFTSHGIAFQPSASSKLSVSDIVADDNSGTGISVAPAGAGVVAAILYRVEANHNNAGITVGGASGSVAVMIRDSVASNNTTTGLLVNGAAAVVRLAHSTISGNATGVSVSSGVLHSYGDNNINGNTSADGAPTDTISLQ